MAFLGLLMFFIANNNIFVLVKPHLKDIAVHFFLQYISHINKWYNYRSFK